MIIADISITIPNKKTLTKSKILYLSMQKDHKNIVADKYCTTSHI